MIVVDGVSGIRFLPLRRRKLTRDPSPLLRLLGVPLIGIDRFVSRCCIDCRFHLVFLCFIKEMAIRQFDVIFLVAVALTWSCIVSDAQPPTPNPSDSTAAPPAGPATPAPATLAPFAGSDETAEIDIVFSDFLEEQEERNNIIRVIQNQVNVTDGRFRYKRDGDTKGYLFGFNKLVRFVITGASRSSPRSALELRTDLLALCNGITGPTQALKNIDVVRGVAVPANAQVPQYQGRTTWDLLYTLVIVAGGLLFVGSCAYLGYRIWVCIRRAREDREIEKNDEEMKSLKKKKEVDSTSNKATVAEDTAAPTWEDADPEDVAMFTAVSEASRQSALAQYQPRFNEAEAARQAEQHFMSKFALPPEPEEVVLNQGQKTPPGEGGDTQQIARGVLAVPRRNNAASPQPQATPARSPAAEQQPKSEVMRQLDELQLPAMPDEQGGTRRYKDDDL